MSSIDVKVPSVGESVTEVAIGSWLKKDGDRVAVDEPICELESDKASMELPAEEAGVLKILKQEGEEVEVGAVIAQIDTSADAGDADGADDEGEATQSTEEQDKKERESSEEKADESDAEKDVQAKKQTDDKTEDASDEKSDEKSDQEADVDVRDSAQKAYAVGHPSPAAEKVLKENNLKPQDLVGSGVNGRITQDDARKASEKAKDKTKEKSSAAPSSSDSQASQGERREKMSRMRKTIAKRLVGAQQDMAVLSTFNEVDMQAIMDARQKHKQAFQDKYGIKLGFMSFFVKACCQALQDFPIVNASIDGDEIVYREHCDISIAVSTPKGLVVPVLRQAETLGFDEIEKRIAELGQRAKEGKLSVDDMLGGSFSITNGGIFGSMLSTPIINPPQSAILGMHNIVERPMAVNGEVQIRPIMYVALSYDHRLIDGRDSVQFLYRVKELLEDPTRLMLAV